MLSVAVAERVVEPEVIDELAEGAVRVTLGAVTSGFETVTDTAEEVAIFPDESVAFAVRLYEPFANADVDQVAVYGAVLSELINVEP